MDLMRKARTLETRITQTLGAAARSLARPGPREPLEIAHAIVAAIEGYIQRGGRDRRVFPFNTIGVSVLAASREVRTRLDAVLVAEPGLQSRIAERLARAGCRGSAPVVRVEYMARSGKGWTDPDFGLTLSNEDLVPDPAVVPTPAIPPRVDLAVIRGTATHRSYALSATRICFGRGAEVRDSRHRLLRANDVAFVEAADDVSRSVSRQHAHAEFDAVARSYRLYDDGSVHGTGVVREGRTVAVPRGGNGVRLRSGDEIVLGDARLHFKITPPA